MDCINKYFNNLTEKQILQFEKLKPVYEQWNAKINVISRKDMDSFYERHVLHSLAIAKVVSFLADSEILDVGTGGGFPGVPLAILFPQTKFTLVDSIGKKIKVVEEVCKELDIKNVTAINSRAEQIDKKFDFIVSRAVTQMPEFVKWVKGKIKKSSKHSLDNGILYLKGGDLTEELASFKNIQLYEISNFFSEEFFETKKVVYLKN
ncbi:16S rRNA (guanine(527)-N(7))-methyltransferase RsmG [Capnocytophaga cynodegmi]|uniref:16S rRNA (guanine(527)-N(7))-methyltransferase RsmG n=1 Tax=Capnocytophaga cynodegmi TaxID=28189 RepID=UPI00385FBD58